MLPQLYVVSQNMLLCILAYIWFRPCQVYKFACETGAKNICDSQVFIHSCIQRVPTNFVLDFYCMREGCFSFFFTMNGADIVLLLNNLMACMHATDGIIKSPSALCLLEWELLEPMLTDRAKQKKKNNKKKKKKKKKKRKQQQKKKQQKTKTKKKNNKKTVKCTRSTWIQLVSLHAFLCL